MKYLYYYLSIYFSRLFAKNETEKFVFNCQLFALKKYAHVRKKYDGKPYYFHVKMVADNALRFRHCLTEEESYYAYIASLFHDLIECDAISYMDLLKLYPYQVVEPVLLCTDLRGRTRKERHSEQFFKELKVNKVASFVKLCDLLANIQYSVDTDNYSKITMYKREYKTYSRELYTDTFDPLFEEIDELFYKD